MSFESHNIKVYYGFMDNLNEIVASNLQTLRKAKKLTQQEFAETLGYSDKSISKWELGKAIPSAEVLLIIADFYNVKVDDILRKAIKPSDTPSENEEKKNRNKIVITALTGCFVLIVATCIFVNGVISDNTYDLWIAFLWSLPAIGLFCGLLTLKFWGKGIASSILLSIFIWGLMLSFSLTFYLFFSQNIFFIFFVGIPLQIALLLYNQLKK